MLDNRKFNIIYKSSIDKLTALNSSFDKGILRVAYTGRNRNNSYISKDTFERCIDSIYNVPIVCNYDRDTNSIGAHDVELIKDGKGMHIVNITQPVGVVPESADYWWEEVTEDNGDIHEYLCVDILIWKRQEAYSKIKENKITDESMEITVKGGTTIDGCYHIDSFEFTAFCLLESAEPCFESARVELFAINHFKDEYEKMIEDFKNSFSMVKTSTEDDIKRTSDVQNLSKGGKHTLDNKKELAEKYGLALEDLDFDIDGLTIEDLETKFKEIKKKKINEDDLDITDDSGDTDDAKSEDLENNSDKEDNESNNETDDHKESGSDSEPQTPEENSYSLTAQQLESQITEALRNEKYEDPCWGEMYKYTYFDHDAELEQVYCYDCEDDWKLVGFNYSLNGDNVVIAFDSKKRKKISVVDFDEGSDTDVNYKTAFDVFGKDISSRKDAEIQSLMQYKNDKMLKEREASEKELFARFPELYGVKEFSELRKNCKDMTIEEIENKCFELKGRNASLSFSITNPQATRIAVVRDNENSKEPYGNLFRKYSKT